MLAGGGGGVGDALVGLQRHAILDARLAETQLALDPALAPRGDDALVQALDEFGRLQHAQYQALPDLVERERVHQGVEWVVDFHQVFETQSGLRKISDIMARRSPK